MEQVKDDKKFFHVFPTLRADDDVRLLFSDVEVKKITTNSRRDFLNIYIFSRHLIQKKQIFSDGTMYQRSVICQNGCCGAYCGGIYALGTVYCRSAYE